jgi:hypothetical protein
VLVLIDPAGGLGAYGDKFLGAGQAFVTNNYAKYFSSTAARYYFDVTAGGVLRSFPGYLIWRSTLLESEDSSK